MALRCGQCGNQTRFEAQRPATLHFAIYQDQTSPTGMREEKLPLGWDVQGEGKIVCRACGSQNVSEA